MRAACSALGRMVAADPAAAAPLLRPGGEAEWAPVTGALKMASLGQQAALCAAAVTRALQWNRAVAAAASRTQAAAAAAAEAAALEPLQAEHGSDGSATAHPPRAARRRAASRAAARVAILPPGFGCYGPCSRSCGSAGAAVG